ncbi:hypothetical protein EPA93_41440 [Ktedonosporobacter rubrisoli]|uniref:Uncharacterized protein n=1 Tax=Ktedonosporobacter rubrisoli TaxID=2509675 RepID=A0A4P6K2H3_KTERU|nr:hypothetical protein [Ktedonosporobacter rubrisoli]QBD82102.1 hypothetical protein EPA93_41440 [Ktedonosporobacter rubrisoli]
MLHLTNKILIIFSPLATVRQRTQNPARPGLSSSQEKGLLRGRRDLTDWPLSESTGRGGDVAVERIWPQCFLLLAAARRQQNQKWEA